MFGNMLIICITKTEDLIILKLFNVINWTEVSRRFASEKSKYKLELGGTKRMANSNRIKLKVV
jgi:hypothetical protein